MALLLFTRSRLDERELILTEFPCSRLSYMHHNLDWCFPYKPSHDAQKHETDMMWWCESSGKGYLPWIFRILEVLISLFELAPNLSKFREK